MRELCSVAGLDRLSSSFCPTCLWLIELYLTWRVNLSDRAMKLQLSIRAILDLNWEFVAQEVMMVKRLPQVWPVHGEDYSSMQNEKQTKLNQGPNNAMLWQLPQESANLSQNRRNITYGRRLISDWSAGARQTATCNLSHGYHYSFLSYAILWMHYIHCIHFIH